MCKKSLLMMLLLALFAPWAANAQTEIVIGTGGSTTSYLPVYALYENSYSQQLFTAEEIGMAGSVTSISFFPTTASNYDRVVDIYMLNVDRTAFASNSEWEAVTSSDLVVANATIPKSITNDWVTIELSTPFDYDGTSTLLVAVNDHTGSWNGKSFSADANMTGKGIYIYRDGTAYDPTTITSGGTVLNVRNNIKLEITPSGTGSTCAKPTGLAISYTGGTTATASWNSEATAWNIDVNGTVTAITTNPYTLTDLALATTYTVKVQANCGGGDLSDWSSAKSFTTDLCLLEDMCEITVEMTDAYGDGGGKIEVVDALTNTVLATCTNTSASTLYTIPVCNGRELNFVFTSTDSWPYENGFVITDVNGNIIAEHEGCASSSSCTAPTNGVVATYLVDCPSCITPTNFTVSDITARAATLNWTSAASAWQIDCNGTISDVTEKPVTLSLEPETDYTVKVRAICGTDEYSDWTSPFSFTTLPSCYAPTDMVISDITASSANIGWTSDNTNFDMRYTTDLDPNNDFETSNLRGWTNIDADGDGYVWVLGSEAAGVYHNDGADVTGNGHNDSYDFLISGSFTNAVPIALTPDNYLVSPQITLGGSITFWAQAQDASYPEEHFGVAVSTTGNTNATDFTTIQEWTMTAKSAGTLRSNNAKRGGNNLRAGNWYQYTVDLSAYSGQGYVAIRHFNCTDQFLLNVDDITIEQPGGFQVNWTDVTNPTNPQALTNLDDATTYVVQVRANCGGDDGVSRWLEGMFTTLPACMVPTNLVISNVDKRSADLAWTSNGEETAWQICLNGDETNLIDVTATTYSFTGLTPETRYTVKVRAVCDATLQSAWSSPVTFTTLVACPAPTALAISDITNVSAVATWTYEGDVELEYAVDPWLHYDNGVYALTMGAGGTIYWGMMLPAESLTAGEPLTKVALHTSYAGEATLNVYLGGDQPTGTPAATQTFTMLGDGDFMEITLDTPVAIDGTQNLWITFYQSGLTYPADGCTGPTDPNGRWVSLDGETWADIAGYGYDYTWMIRAAFGNASTEWVAVNNPASPQTITGLTPETNYLVRLRAVCGGEDGESVWVNTSFTTDIACPAPTALGATPYANSAVLSWEGISESYTVSYRTAAYTEGVSEEFATTSAPTGWTRYSTLLTDDVLNGTTALATYNGGWNFGTSNGVFDSHARLNIYGTTCNYWLVTPAMTVAEGSEFSFDLALTNYNGTLGAPATTGTDDKFVVLVSTDEMASWTILRQWDNAGSEYVYNNIANTATGENVSFDFSAYAGQTVYVAFYGESTTRNADNNLHIDNVAIGTAMPAGEWMTVNVDEATATITGLTPETKYEWKVQGDCGEYGMSEESTIMSFTTTNDLCPVPTNLTVDAETLTATTADLSWEGSPDVESFTVRYRVPEHIVGGMSESFDVSGVPAGWTRYSGLVDNVIAGTATLTSTTSGWNFSNTNVFGEYHAKVNIFGTTCKYWLVTPEVTLSSGNFSFDLALTAYNSSNAASGTCEDERFVVLVYANETWTILREWNNSGSDYVYNTIATEGEAVSIDLSAYVGQTVKIAFYGESTVGSNGDNDLHIDNVVIGDPQTIPATDWMTVTTEEMSVTLTGLTPETPYEAQVKADCSDPEAWSNTASFTTLPQTNVTQTIELVEGTNWFSTYVNITLADLKAALVAALPTGNSTTITIKSKDKNVKFQRGRWVGQLSEADWDLAKMYQIEVNSACEITLEGEPIDPTELTLNIVEGTNWIAFPYNTSMTVTNLFTGFAINNDQVKSKDLNTKYNGRRWAGQLTTLVPGQGYRYESSSTTVRTFTFPAAAK